jgi:hypothetical protein
MIRIIRVRLSVPNALRNRKNQSLALQLSRLKAKTNGPPNLSVHVLPIAAASPGSHCTISSSHTSPQHPTHGYGHLRRASRRDPSTRTHLPSRTSIIPTIPTHSPLPTVKMWSSSALTHSSQPVSITLSNVVH